MPEGALVDHEGLPTTDAKVIPALVGRHVAAGCDLVESFRRTVSAFEGSVAIGAMSAQAPDTMLLALATVTAACGQAQYVAVPEPQFTQGLPPSTTLPMPGTSLLPLTVTVTSTPPPPARTPRSPPSAHPPPPPPTPNPGSCGTMTRRSD